MSPAPKKPAPPRRPREPRAQTPAPAVGPRPPVPAAGTGQLVPGGSASAPLPALTRERPDAPDTPLVAGLSGRTPGVALPRGAAIREPWPTPVQIERVSAAPLETGLSDYAFWMAYFAEHDPPPPPPGGFRRGEIWA